MKKIELMNDLVNRILSKKGWFVFLPFSIVVLVLIGCYYIVASLYMLFDIFVVEIQNLFNKNQSNESNGAQTVKYLIGFIYLLFFKLVTTAILIAMGVLYFLITVFLYISSLGQIKEFPYAFHIEEN